MADARPARVVAISWFGLAFFVMLWMYDGPDTRSFITPDEARERQAAEAFATSGRTRIDVVAEGPAGLLTPRGWATSGDQASYVGPSFAAVLRGVALQVPVVGSLVVMSISAFGAAALAGATALAASRWRLFVGAVAPLVTFPTTFWLSHYWMNLALFNALIALAIVGWLLSRRESAFSRVGVYAYPIGLASAMAVRPDFAFYAVTFAFFASLVAAPDHWRRHIALHFTIGVAAISLALFSNILNSGDPLSFGYISQRADRADITGIEKLPPAFDALRILLSPQGIPDGGATLTILRRNFVALAWAVTLLGLFAVSVTVWTNRSRRAAAILGLAGLLAVFAVARASSNLNAAAVGELSVQNSYMRYMSPVFLIVGVASFSLLTRLPRGAGRVGLPIVLAAALIGGYYLFAPGAPDSLYAERARTARLTEQARQVAEVVPPGSLIFTCSADKILWNVSHVGSIRDGDAQSVATTAHALSGDRFVHFFAIPEPALARIRSELDNQGAALVQPEGTGLWTLIPGPDPGAIPISLSVHEALCDTSPN
jgi:hypothetical protein